MWQNTVCLHFGAHCLICLAFFGIVVIGTCLVTQLQLIEVTLDSFLSFCRCPKNLEEEASTWLQRVANSNEVIKLQLQSYKRYYSPPARWGLLDFMSVASSSSSSFSSSSSPPPPRPPRRPRRPRRPCSTATRDPQCSLPDLNHDHPRPVFPAGPQPRPSTPNVPCRTSTTTILAQCSLPDLNHDHPRPVFPAGPQPRVSTPSVPCRTSCRKIWDKECAEES